MTMKLTPEREEELMEQNDYNIKKAVNRFSMRSRIPFGNFAREDLLQEVRLVFLNHIRKCDNEEDIDSFPWRDALNAMCLYVLKSQEFAVPSRSTKEFSKIMNEIKTTMSYGVIAGEDLPVADNWDLGGASFDISVNGMSPFWVADENTRIDLDAFMNNYEDYLVDMAIMRLHGLSYRQIGELYDLSDKTVHKKIKKMYRDYKKFNSGGKTNV